MRFLWREYRWLIVGLSWIVAFVLGIIGSRIQFARLGEPRSFLDALHSAFQLFFFESNEVVSAPHLPWQLDLARFLAPAVAAYTALVALAAILHEKANFLRLRFLRGHVVMCGLGEKGYQLLRDLLEHGDRVVVVDSQVGNPFLSRAKHHGALVIQGDAISKNLLRKMRIHRARVLVAMCGDDGTNLEVAINAHQVIQEMSGKGDFEQDKITCFTHVVDGKLAILYKQSRNFPEPEERFEVRFFNIYDSGARALLRDFPPDGGFSRILGSPRRVLIVGFERMGWAVLVHALRMAQGPAGTRMQVSVVDRQARRRERIFGIHYPRYPELCAIEFIEMDIGDPEYYEASFAFNEDGTPRVHMVYVCQETDAAGLSAALRLAHRLFAWKIPIVVCMREDTGLARLVEEKPGDAGVATVLNAMGMIARTCTREMILSEDLDLLARELYRSVASQRKGSGSDSSIRPWEWLFEEVKDSYRHQADHIPVKLKAIGCLNHPAQVAPPGEVVAAFSEEEVDFLAKMEHQRRRADRILEGLRAGPGKSGGESERSMARWEDLSDADKEDRRDRVRMIPDLLARVGERIVRVPPRA